MIPDKSTLRKNYLELVFEEIVQNIRNEIGSNFVYISDDEIFLKTSSRISIYKNIMDGLFRMDLEKIAAYKFAPFTSVDVER